MLKNTLFFTAALSFFAIGCSGDDEKIETGDTGTTAGDDDDDDTVEPLNELDDSSLTNAVACDGTSVTFSAGFFGAASEGYFDAADTDNWDTTYGNWNDTHTLDAINIATDDSYTDLESPAIMTGGGLTTWSDGVSTVFRCDYHYESAGTMTYAVRAYDLNGALADCAAWGNDPQGFIDDSNPDGAAYVTNARPQNGDFAGCRTVTAAK